MEVFCFTVLTFNVYPIITLVSLTSAKPSSRYLILCAIITMLSAYPKSYNSLLQMFPPTLLQIFHTKLSNIADKPFPCLSLPVTLFYLNPSFAFLQCRPSKRSNIFGIPNSSRALQRLFRFTLSQDCFKSIKRWCRKNSCDFSSTCDECLAYSWLI